MRNKQDFNKILKEVNQDNDQDDDPRFQKKIVDPQHSIFNRKQQRKDKKLQKKQKKQQFYQKIEEVQQDNIQVEQEQITQQKPQKSEQQKKEEKELKEKEKMKEQHRKMLLDDEREIEMLSKKLGLKSDNSDKLQKRQRKIMKNEGLDDGLLDMLDNIGKIVKTDASKYKFQQYRPDVAEIKIQQLNDEQEQDDDMDICDTEDFDIDQDNQENEYDQDDNDDEDDQNEYHQDDEDNQTDNQEYDDDDEIDQNDQNQNYDDSDDEGQQLFKNQQYDDDVIEFEVDENDLKDSDLEEEQQNSSKNNQKKYKQENTIQQKQQIQDNNLQLQQSKLQNKSIDEDKLGLSSIVQGNAGIDILSLVSEEKKLELRKKLNGCINRLSEGNIHQMLNQMLELYQGNSKFVLNELLQEIFIKAAIDQTINLQYLVACNCALISSLHKFYDNEFFSVFAKNLIIRYKQLLNGKILMQLKFCITNCGIDDAILVRLKNLSLIIAYFYIFDTISIEFIKGYIENLCENFNEDYLEILVLLIQHTGIKIRKDNPAILKDIIVKIEDIYHRKQLEKNLQNQTLSKKFDFLKDMLSDIKANKKLKSDPLERLEFLINFVKKDVIQKFKLTNKTFSTNFQFCFQSDFSGPHWWTPLTQYQQSKLNTDTPDIKIEVNEQRAFLEKLASEQKFNTDTRKRIFMIVMSSEDYLDATQQLLKLKLNKNQKKEIAIVITECCAQEKTFNKFYALLAEKLIEIENYCLWDHFKQLENYQITKIYNLGKLMSHLVSQQVMGLVVLRNVDFENVSEHMLLLLKVFLNTFLSITDLNKIRGMCQRTQQNEETMLFRETFCDFLKSYFIENINTRMKNLKDEAKILQLDENKTKLKTLIRGLKTLA